MKKTICENCTNYTQIILNNRTTVICSVNRQETRRFKECPCGYTEDEINAALEKGRLYDEWRSGRECPVG